MVLSPDRTTWTHPKLNQASLRIRWHAWPLRKAPRLMFSVLGSQVPPPFMQISYPISINYFKDYSGRPAIFPQKMHVKFGNNWSGSFGETHILWNWNKVGTIQRRLALAPAQGGLQFRGVLHMYSPRLALCMRCAAVHEWHKLLTNVPKRGHIWRKHRILAK